MLVLALWFAPLLSALTHGPGQIALMTEHAAWHAEQGAPGEATEHGHPDAGDHDHSPTVILPAGGDIPAPSRSKDWVAQARPLDGTIRDGPRRPPRLS